MVERDAGFPRVSFTIMSYLIEFIGTIGACHLRDMTCKWTPSGQRSLTGRQLELLPSVLLQLSELLLLLCQLLLSLWNRK